MQVRRSTIVDAPIEAVWGLLRDFNGHAAWHPAVAESRLEDGASGTAVGAVRAFRLADGSRLREQLIGFSEAATSFTYCLIESPIPLMGYVATVRLRPVTEGSQTFWEWESRFDPPPGQAEALIRLVADEIYVAGFRAVQSLLRTGRAPADAPSAPLPVPARPAPIRAQPAPRPVPTASGGALAATAIVADRYGGPEVLQVRTVAVAPPGPGQVRLRHTAIGVNFIDVYCRTGYFDLLVPPGTPGMEAAGVVVDVGDGVGLSAGDRVAYACPPVGAYADARTMDAALLVRLPPDIADETAAAAMLKGLSAEFLLHRVHPVRPGDVVLVHAASGGVGLFLCQWAAALGATVIGTVSNDQKAELAQRSGCAHAIVYTRENFVAAVRAITDGRGADVIYDAVGRDTFEGSFEALAICGHLVSFGQASGPIGPVNVDRLVSKSATLSRPNFGHYTGDPPVLARMAERLFAAIRQGTLHVTIGQRFSLAEAAAAHRALEGRATIGSTILLPG